MVHEVIYCLFSKIEKMMYIGKTRQGSQRLVKHRHDYKRYLNGKYGFCSSYKIIECPDCEFLILRYMEAGENPNEAEKEAIKYHRTVEGYKLVNIMHNH
tara:strand:- start:371 stop:667 length:297 start_codon:yes stop_codon:yes gene_type:complete